MDRYQKMILGRRASYLRRCIKVNELILEHETENTVRSRVFEKYIKKQVGISYTTFNNMLNEVAPQKQLEDIEKQLQIKK